MTPWCNYKWLAKLPQVGTHQFIDRGRKVVILTQHAAFKKRFRASDKLMAKLACDKLHEPFRGMHFTCDPDSDSDHYNVIFIDHLIHGDKKLLAVIVHELSHLVDYMFESASVKVIDTEFRAYLLDYYTERVFMMMKFTYDTGIKALEHKDVNV